MTRSKRYRIVRQACVAIGFAGFLFLAGSIGATELPKAELNTMVFQMLIGILLMYSGYISYKHFGNATKKNTYICPARR